MKELISKITDPSAFFKGMVTPAKFIQTGWEKLSKVPGGNRLFSKLASKYIPYTGSVRPTVKEITSGKACVVMQDRPQVRNHLNSIHGIALANLGEFTTGLSLYSQLKDKQKAILVNLQVKYLKKARGELLGETLFKLPESFQTDTDFDLVADIKNKQNEVVSQVTATWRVRL